MKHRPLDAEPDLPLALGASIEVTAQSLAARGRRSEAVAFLQQELRTWHATSMGLRIQKNLNLLTMEGRPAPALDITHYVGPPPVPVNLPTLDTPNPRTLTVPSQPHMILEGSRL